MQYRAQAYIFYSQLRRHPLTIQLSEIHQMDLRHYKYNAKTARKKLVRFTDVQQQQQQQDWPIHRIKSYGDIYSI